MPHQSHTVLAFDVYGTLIDIQGVTSVLAATLGEQAAAFSTAWRSKQLEYSFRRGLMQNYAPFSVVTEQALDFCIEQFQLDVTADTRASWLDAYHHLPAFDDARRALDKLAESEARLFAFSNGTEADVNALLEQAGLTSYFEDVVSVDALRSFKPNPGVYAHFMREADSHAHQSWLISGNPFDVIGARSAGMRAAWVKRDPNAVYDPWGIEPDIVVSDLSELVQPNALSQQVKQLDPPHHQLEDKRLA
ncbi:MAG: haloacid dehalogenase type II [Oceanobacter sp.]